MMRCLAGLVLGIVLLMGSGCETTEGEKLTKQEREAIRLEEERAMLDRLQLAEITIAEILDPMVKVTAQYNSRESHGYVGAGLTSIEMVHFELHGAARERGIGNGITVSYVMPGSAAAIGGLKRGDLLVELNGRSLPKGSGGSFNWLQKRLRKEWLLEETNVLKIERGGEEMVLEVEAVQGNSYNIVIIPHMGATAHADGHNLFFDLMTVEGWSRERLEYLVANVLVQNSMRHEKMKTGNQALGMMVDLVAGLSGVNTGNIFQAIGRGAYETGFLVESDLLALYLLAYLDLDYEGYVAFWHERLPRDRKERLTKVSKQRFDAMRQVVEEIKAKIEAGEEVYPTEYLAGEWKLLPPPEEIEKRVKEIESTED
ncbi:MAG: M48 family metallopeptidase [Verrucomicrobiota bacterium]